jgi:hypothetical protein
MTRVNLLLLLLSFSVSAFSQAESTYGTSAVAIQKVLKEAYIDGVFNKGIVSNVELGFSGAFTMFSLSEDGTLKTVGKQDWIDRVRQLQAEGFYPAVGENFVHMKIVSINIEDKAAMVKLQFYRGTELAYIDFIGLYYYNEDWKIVSKIFTEK